jgi:hypothetical protein
LKESVLDTKGFKEVLSVGPARVSNVTIVWHVDREVGKYTLKGHGFQLRHLQRLCYKWNK